VKKSFSLIEVVIAVSILSVVMVSLLQIKSDNIFLISKTNEQSKLYDYIQLSIDFNKINQENQEKQENEELFLDKKFTFDNDDIRKELKDIKVKIREKKEDENKIDTNTTSLNITTYSRVYSIDNSIKKKIYNFKIEL
jgi:type II secretory pathway pseudopilin PulG